MRGLVIGSLVVLATVGGVVAQLSCQCNSGILRGLQVCATDGKTYSTPCELTNAQRSNAALGLKCLGPCPCPAPSPVVSAVCTRYGLWSNITGTTIPTMASSTTTTASTSTRSTTVAATSTTTAAQPPAPIQPFSNALKPGRRHGGRSHGKHHGHGGRSSSEERPGFGPRPPMGPPICLTNGTTVYDPVAVRCAVANPSNPGAGIRCFGSCRFCAAAPFCPGVMVNVPSSNTTPAGGQTAATMTPTAAPLTTPGASTPEPIIDFAAQSKAIFQNAAFN